MSDNNWAQKYLDELNDKLKISQNSAQPKKSEQPKTVVEKVQSKAAQSPPASTNNSRDRLKENKKFRKDKFKGPEKKSSNAPEQKHKKPQDTGGKGQQNVRTGQSQVKPQATFKIRALSGFVSSIDNKEYIVTAENKDYRCFAQESILRQGPIYIGDRVRITLRADDRGLIDKYEPRQNYLASPSGKGKEIVQAANVNQVLLVVSVKEPVLRTDWLDAHLTVCEKRGFKPIICCTKIDLAEDNLFLEQMEIYKRMGYRIIYTSSVLSSALQDLRVMLKNKTTVLTGHAGVGKTALFKSMTETQRNTVVSEPEDFDAASEDYAETQRITCVKLEAGGYLIDTPGVREYEIGGIIQKDLKKYFRDFRNYNSQCASLECSHMDEPGCRIIEAVKEGEISEDRYQNYLRILENLTA